MSRKIDASPVTHQARRLCPSQRGYAARAGIVCLLLALGGGCSPGTVPPATEKPPPMSVGARKAGDVPDYMRGTVWEFTDVENTGPFPVTSYGLVVGLRGTGDSFAPTAVREWMIKELVRHGFQSQSLPGYAEMTPERVLADPRAAIVIVGGMIPPGARKDHKFDVQVQALEGNNTTSLAKGNLYRCDLRIFGANPQNPGGSVNPYAVAQGSILVNPANSLKTATQPGAAQQSLRVGIIPNGGLITKDRPLHLHLREPQWALSRNIEQRIIDRFQATNEKVAAAQDAAFVHLLVPRTYNGNWEHFAGVATHLYMNGSAEYLDARAQRLAEEAVKPGAALQDISYCWEGIGPAALPHISPLLTHKSPDVCFAAAQAAASLGDRAAEDILMAIARAKGHPFQLNAIRALGELPPSAVINNMLATLLNVGQSNVRIEAYRVLAANRDSHVWSKPINDAFMLDVIPTTGTPLIYASRVGEPRVAVFARLDQKNNPRLPLNLPITFSAFDSKLTITSPLENPRTVTIVYRGGSRALQPVVSNPDVAEIVARLGGESDDRVLRFGYGDVVAVLQSLSETNKINAQFVLQDMPGFEDAPSNDAPVIPDVVSRPQASAPQATTPPANTPPGPDANGASAKTDANVVAPVVGSRPQ